MTGGKRGVEAVGVNELLFYGGAAAAAAALVLGCLAFILFKVRRARLNAQLDREYGAPEKEPGHSRPTR